jgi:hypothetical protein
MTLFLNILLVAVFTIVYLLIQVAIEKWIHTLARTNMQSEKMKRKLWSGLQMAYVTTVLVGILFGEMVLGKTIWTAEVWMFIMVLCLPVSIRIAIFSEHLNSIMGWKRGFVGVTAWWDRWIKYLHVKIGYKVWYRWIPLIINTLIIFGLWLNLT